MKGRHCGGLICLSLISIVTILSQQTEAQSRILVVRDKAFDVELFAQTTNFLAANFWVPVRSTVPIDISGLETRDQGSTVQKLLRSNDIAAIAFVVEKARVAETVLVATNAPIALVDLTSLKGRASSLGNETPLARPLLLQKETMRAIGAIFGLRNCLNPLCCMNETEINPGTGIIGVNFCPPCLVALEKILSPDMVSATKRF